MQLIHTKGFLVIQYVQSLFDTEKGVDKYGKMVYYTNIVYATIQ